MIKSIPLRALPRILVTNFLLQVTNDQKKWEAVWRIASWILFTLCIEPPASNRI